MIGRSLIGYSDIAIDSAGNAYVTGNALTWVADGGSSSPVVLKLNPTGSAALYKTYLGGWPATDTLCLSILLVMRMLQGDQR